MDTEERDAIDDIRRRIDHFLIAPMAESLRGLEYAAPSPGDTTTTIVDAAQANVLVSHVLGNAEATYLIDAFGERLTIQIQLNVYRLVVVYRIPLPASLDSTAIKPRFARWEAGANHAGWRIGWRDAIDPENFEKRRTEIYCYAMLPQDFLNAGQHQLYWMNDIVQMTRAFFLEARRIDVRLSDQGAQPRRNRSGPAAVAWRTSISVSPRPRDPCNPSSDPTRAAP